MRNLTRLLLSVVFAVVVDSAQTVRAKPFSFPRSTPEAQSVSSSALLTLVEALDQIDAMNSFMLVRHGKVIAEGWWAPYRALDNHELYSLSKSFTSTAVGMAVADGKLSIDDVVLKFFPEDAPVEQSANLKAMRVRDLLTMNAGHQDEIPTAPDKLSARAFLAHPVPHKPGTHFKYNTPATFMLSAIVQKQMGQTVFDYLKPRLFEPLGITQPTWNTNWQGINLGGYGLSVRTEDIARLGQLYLQKGQWQGKQLLPQDWVATATSKQVSNGSNPQSDWDQGYGFQFWRCRHDAFRGDGAFGQYCVVLPQQDAVVAITSGVKDMQAVLNVLWEKLLPALGSKRLSADRVSQKKLQRELANLSVRPPDGNATSPIASKVAGRKFVFPVNEQKLESVIVTPNTDGKTVGVVVQTAGGTSEWSAGYRSWQKGRASFGTYINVPAAATCAWSGDDTLVIKQCLTETPFYITHTLRFDGNQLYYVAQRNVGFGPSKQPQLTGHSD